MNSKTETKLESKKTTDIDKELLVPDHVAIIMDGNRRWATRNKLKFLFGHKRGVKVFEDVLQYLSDNGAKVFTVYAFSTENWKREDKQVNDLLKVIGSAILENKEKLKDNNIIVRVLGQLKDFPDKVRTGFEDLIEDTKNNTGIILNFALSYGGRNEIVRAVNKAVEKGKEVTEESFGKLLDTGDLPDPKIVIRTGGEMRLSNFLLWQLSYSEMFFTKTLWPDFQVAELEKIISEFNCRKVNNGK